MRQLLQCLANTYTRPDVGKFPSDDNPVPAGYVTHIMPTHIGGVGPWAG